MVICSPSSFLALGCSIVCKKNQKPNNARDESFFRSTFNSSPEVCSHTWEYLTHHKKKPKKSLPKHLLWALLFLKSYATEPFLAGLIGVSEKTFRKWVWIMIAAVNMLYSKIIRWEKRLLCDGGNEWCTTATDGTDFLINQPSPFDKRWFSHKFKGPGLRYEVSLSINGGHIVWTNGPFPCGAWPDITIFRHGLIDKLKDGEMTEADLGYRGQPDKIRLPTDWHTKKEKKMKRLARARQEHINSRFKNYKILKLPFQHDLTKHKEVFRAICVLCELAIENGKCLFACEFK